MLDRQSALNGQLGLLEQPYPTCDRKTVSNQNSPRGRRLSAAQQARLRLAANRLKEAREADLSRTAPAELLFTINRLTTALDDIIGLAEEVGPSEDES